MRITMNVPPGCFFTPKGIRRIVFKKPSKRYSERQFRRDKRRLVFCKDHSIPTNLDTLKSTTNEPALQS